MEDESMNSLASPKGLDFEALVREHQSRVFNIALRVTRDRASAEDVTQQVFLTLFQRKGLPPGVAQPNAFVARVAVNAALNALRAEERRARHEEMAPERRKTAMSPTDALDREEVRAAVDDLPVELRLPVVLHYFQGMTHAEVAESLDVAEGTVSWRLHKAMGQLRTALAALGVVLLADRVEAALAGVEGEAVPVGLTERLLEIPSMAASPAPPGFAKVPPLAPATGGPSTTVLLLMVAFFVAAIAAVKLTSSSPGGKTSVTVGPMGPSVASRSGGSAVSVTTTPARGTSGGDASPSARVEPREELTTVEGFLLHRPDGGLIVDDVLTVAAQTGATTHYVLDAESAKAFEGVAIGGDDFVRFLQEDDSIDSTPRLWVRLRGTVRKEGGGTVTRHATTYDLGMNWFTTREVVETDSLSDAWLKEWRAARRALASLAGLLNEPPSPTKRERFVSLSQQALHGAEEMRHLRAVEAPPATLASLPPGGWWRKRQERGVLRSLRDLGGPFGLVPVGVPELPADDALRAAFLSARDQADLRAAIVSKWGEDALDESLGYYDGRPESYTWTVVSLPVVMRTWSAEEFLATQARANAIASNHPKAPAAPQPEPPEYAAHRARTAAEGLDVEDLGDLDRQANLVTLGVRVRSVTQGGLADRAGVRVGDVIWRVYVPNQNEMAGELGKVMPQQPCNPVNFGCLLGEAKALDAVRVDVLRDGQLVEVTLPLR